MKSSYKLSFVFIVSLLLLSTNISGQEVQSGNILQTKSIKPFRLGIKLGIPNLITANAEYVTPLLNNRVALTVDYMSLSPTIYQTTISYNNFEVGTNIYFSNKGKGYYGSITYFMFNGDGTYTDVEFEPNTYEDGKGNIKFNTVNFKIGLKLGRTFYVRSELGYGFGSIPDKVEITSNTSSKTSQEDMPAFPGLSSSGIINLNFGIGFSFL